ncbi:MAG: 23S rRNA (adenine(2503)-C(2))-methyltransferase RlmN [Saprospiraceae bacterium]|nr:23S rRNA (adenine(2503)-C(2))-methyltransferase RlmN [Saprospiraceae bacterium]
MTDAIAKIDIRLLTKKELEETLVSLGEPKFRAKQLLEWMWKKGVTDFEEMTNLSKSLREKLQEKYTINSIVLDKSQNSLDGTIKSRFKLHDGTLIESVLIPVPDHDRFTVCVSTQVGCSLTCKFCATGQMGRIRNLDAGEIFDQVIAVNQQCMETFQHPLTNIVYMGMGEPLLTYKNTMESIHWITAPEGLGWSPKRITVSTAGIAKMINKLADDNVKFNLALSLHAADDTKRDTIMPINEQNSLGVLIDSLEYFYKKTGNRISYEYIAFQGFNDNVDDAVNLAKLCKKFPVRVNIIEYNQIDGVTFEKSDENRLDKFAAHLTRLGVTVTVRRSRGKDIDAACGQLANKV